MIFPSLYSLIFSNGILNALLMFFVLTSLFGFFFAENRRLSGVKLFFVAKYRSMYLLASSPIKQGCFLAVPCFNSLFMFILRGIFLLGSRFFILSFLMLCGVKPDCLIIVKKAFSLIGTLNVILFIRLGWIISFFKSATIP